MKKIGIVEDEVLIANSLERNLAKHGYEVLPPAMDFDEAIEMIDEGNPDLVILDINLNGEKVGVKIAEHIREHHDLPFIFLTSHLDKQTLESAKSTQPAGYLTKPFHFESLYTTIEVALYNFIGRNKAGRQISLKTGTQTELVPIDQIIFLKTEHVYVEVVLPTRTLLVRKPLKELLSELPEDSFFQVHRSYAVNIRHVVSFGPAHIVLSGIEVPVSRSYRDEIMKRFS